MREASCMGTQRQVMQDYLDSLVKRADYSVYFPMSLLMEQLTS
jgi:hypothetical protein